MSKIITYEAKPENESLTIVAQVVNGSELPLDPTKIRIILNIGRTAGGLDAPDDSKNFLLSEATFGGARTATEALLYLKDLRDSGLVLAGY